VFHRVVQTSLGVLKIACLPALAGKAGLWAPVPAQAQVQAPTSVLATLWKYEAGVLFSQLVVAERTIAGYTYLFCKHQ